MLLIFIEGKLNYLVNSIFLFFISVQPIISPIQAISNRKGRNTIHSRKNTHCSISLCLREEPILYLFIINFSIEKSNFLLMPLYKII